MFKSHSRPPLISTHVGLAAVLSRARVQRGEMQYLTTTTKSNTCLEGLSSPEALNRLFYREVQTGSSPLERERERAKIRTRAQAETRCFCTDVWLETLDETLQK